ncbi:SusC/RagA family TonB-linked outer membrane protein [Pedobacter heparinus]|uniref:TonB-dependent receptor n=1 Tax=Pedobacter heparinus (strain ATCC 13125 / DSM 2366 / CIP 104194 / JCM 7457 / NBRC 12017 / NCIMB 9290 / NRRL B-14731 / HIM 762-3) TaxID=485917 RepID=C6XTJ2_PEDHD|nr:TonB-dependent receptor [Pedobacter heparinus]ACU05770.1 TonB-dependent receptor [Pedobacter heparinus DSM 2366]
MKKLLLCWLPLILFPFFKGYAQVPVSGTVKDTQGGVLPGVSIKLKGTTTGVTTTSSGTYSISVPDASAVLVFSFIGMESQEIQVSGKRTIDVVLTEQMAALKEVLVIGYGSQSRETVTTSVTKLDNKVLENVPYANLTSAMQGTLSGVRVQSTSGQPGDASRVVIRGGTSINNPNGAAPLYIVDGVIKSNINDINSQDIESMQVLKDAAATAIYGARGSNGVVILVTKSGKSGIARINYNYDLTISDLGKGYDMVSARDYIYFQRLGIGARGTADPSQLTKLGLASSAGTGNDLTNNTAFTPQYLSDANRYKLNEGWESMPDPIDPTKTIIFKNTDFQDVVYRTALSNNHTLSGSGGTDKATFSASLGYQSNEGIAIFTDYKRLSFNLNGDFKVNEKLKIFGRVMYSNSSGRTVTDAGSNVSNVFARSATIPATTKYKFEDGTLAPGLNSSLGNLEYFFNTQDLKNSLENLTMVTGAHFDILPGLSFDPQISLYKITSDGRFFQKAYLNGPGQLVNSRNATGSYAKQIQEQADAVFTYKKNLKDAHHLEAKIGFSAFWRTTAGLNASGRGASTDLIPTLNASAVPVSVGGDETNQLILGYFSRINYDYKEKYLLSLNARYDGASNLGTTHKWGLFPGVSVGWNIHKEDFWTALPERLFTLKLRGSYGVNGNISGLGPYQSQGQYSVGAQYNGIAAVQNTTLANADLRWEQSKTFDVGFDLGVLNNRINILFDYYRRRTDNLLTNFSLPQSTGFASVLTNLGSLQNKGIELELSAKILPEKSDFQWILSLNASRVKNKILKLPNNGIENNRIGGVYVWDSSRNDYAWLGGLQEGGEIGDLYAYKQLGIYATDAEAQRGPKDMLVVGTAKTKFGGDVNWQDADNNGVIDERDRVFVGNIYPKWTGGMASTMTYRNFDLYVRMDYTTGHTIYNYTRAMMIGQFVGENGFVSDVLRSWQTQGQQTDIPRIYWADQQAQNNLFRGNSAYYEAGDFLALREVTLSYNFSPEFLKKIKIANLRLNATGSNLHYFTKFKGLNPEEGGDDRGRYPIPRNIIFGANITF